MHPGNKSEATCNAHFSPVAAAAETLEEAAGRKAAVRAVLTGKSGGRQQQGCHGRCDAAAAVLEMEEKEGKIGGRMAAAL